MNGLVISSQSFGASVNYATILLSNTPVTISATNKRMLFCSSTEWGYGNFFVIKGVTDIKNVYVSDGYIDLSWIGDTISLKLHNYTARPLTHQIALI